MKKLFKNAWKYDLILKNEINIPFYVNKKRTVLSSYNSESVTTLFGELTSISAIDAVREFGIDHVEYTREKMYSVIKRPI